MSSSPPSRRNPKPQSTGTSPPTSQQQSSLTDNPRPIEPDSQTTAVVSPAPSPSSRKRKQAEAMSTAEASTASASGYGDPGGTADTAGSAETGDLTASPAAKKSRTNTPWTPAEERRLKSMRDAGNSWNEIAKTFPTRTEGSVKKHWYKDMHYADFAEDESAALLAAIKEYEASKWKVIGQKVGKPAKACEQYAKEHFGGRI